MHPTTDEQLSGARRLLDQTIHEPGLSAGSRELLTNVQRLLAQVSRSWAALPAFHRTDNDELLALLTSLRGLAAPGTARHLDSLPREPGEAGQPAAEAQRNVQLRALLTQLIRDLPPTSEGNAARTTIARYLRRRVDSDPS